MDYASLIDRFTIAEDNGNGHYLAYCPAHGDTQASLIIGPGSKAGYVVLNCRAHCTFEEVVKAAGLDRKVLSGGVRFDGDVTPVTHARRDMTDDERAEMEKVAANYRVYLTLPEGRPGRDYLKRRFGIEVRTEEDAKAYGVGYSPEERRVTLTARRPDGSFAFTQRRAIDADVPKHLKVLTDKKPADDVKASLVGFVGPRRADAPVLVCEGITDALAAAWTGDYDVLCVAGAGNAAQVASVSEALAGRTVYIAGDGDASGESMTAKAAAILAPVADVRAVALPAKKDVADIVSEGGADGLSALLGTATRVEASEALSKASTASDGDEDEGGKRKRSLAARIVDRVREDYRIIRASDGKAYAVPRVGPRLALSIESVNLKATADLFNETGAVATDSARRAAKGILEADAFTAEETDVYLRAAYDRDENAVYIDLGDKAGSIIRVDEAGWREAHPEGEGPVFRRIDATQALPLPTRPADGVREDFAALLGWEADSDEFLLAWGWAVGAFFEDVARPMLWATGPQGSGKTTRMRMLLGLVDPADELGSPPGRNERDDSTRAFGRFVVTFDNLRDISATTSDWLCRLVTGVNVEARSLFTDSGMHVMQFKRTALMTSINLPYGLGPDALERIITLRFERLDEYRNERLIDREYEAMRSQLVGALLDDVSGVLAHLSATEGNVTSTRMAAFAGILEALDLHSGRRHTEAYRSMLADAMEERVTDDPWLSAVVALVFDKGDVWASPATLSRLIEDKMTEIEPDLDTGIKTPKARGMRHALQNAAVPLRRAGVVINDSVVRNGVRGIRLTLAGAPTEEAIAA